ncbi:MAG: hypothetical protein H6Q70_619 [Firmicutes bacterium]|nr:hypothetical protein [Bacillota bacterium]
MEEPGTDGLLFAFLEEDEGLMEGKTIHIKNEMSK